MTRGSIATASVPGRPQATRRDPHPNIILLHATFQDYATLYFLLELCPGGEMWSRTLTRMDQAASRPPTR